MVIYDLECDAGHQFEGWFKNADELQQQHAQGLLSCPFCESTQVRKKLTASKVAAKSNSSHTPSPGNQIQEVAAGTQQSPEQYAQVQKMLHQLYNYVDTNFEDVGNRFAEEAISIHRGEKDAANIRGTASQEEVRKMAEEGVQPIPLPARPIDKEKLN